MGNVNRLLSLDNSYSINRLLRNEVLMIKAQIFSSGDQWYWRIKSANGRVIADGAEGYSSKQNCKRALDKFFQNIVNLVSTKGQTLHQMENNIELEITVEILDNKGRVVQEY